MEDRKSVTGFLWGDLRGKDHFEDLGVEGNMVLKRFFKKWNGELWTGSIGLRIGTVAGTCECGNEPSGSIKCG
jgi:hypothetical protein